MKKYEGIVQRGELVALHADVDGLRGEMLRLEEEWRRAQVGGWVVMGCSSWGGIAAGAGRPGAVRAAQCRACHMLQYVAALSSLPCPSMLFSAT